ncbi:DUF3151 domain-containing protein [Actinospica sp.]|jgi:hypothetical protein|uniref:DUF3151 domain-containing protein n=1 Tax=Actinospica sp. TaxID=1872142 RepID=UPI002D1C4EB1|nr:DUF3151 domain-containing protein [Actinospica sp.]HWG25316.1 DUF3151 domain-containing protein [Actinospica sp.]
MPENLIAGPPPTFLPTDPKARGLLDAGTPLKEVAAACPTSSLAWALLAEQALDAGETVTAYAYARTGYHRGLDALRRNGWKGHGPIPWSHAPNQGFLRALRALSEAAGEIGELEEAERCAAFLTDSDPTAPLKRS